MGLLAEGTTVAVRWQRGNLTGIALMFTRFRGILCSRSSVLSRNVTRSDQLLPVIALMFAFPMSTQCSAMEAAVAS